VKCCKFKCEAYLTGCIRNGDTYTANSAAELIKKIVALLSEEGVKSTSFIRLQY